MTRSPPVLREFQREDVDFIKAHKLRVLNASSMGVGKTITTIVSILETHKTSLPALVVCPASVVRNWRREIKKWAPGVIPITIEGMTAPMPGYRQNAIYIVSWTSLDARVEALKQFKFNCVVGDEIHSSKDIGAIRSQAFFDLVTDESKGLICLSGTPLINRMDELTTIKRLYGTEDPPILRRMLEDIAPDVPPKRRAYIPVQLRPQYRKIYTTANEDFEAWLTAEQTKKDKHAQVAVDITMSAEALAKVGYLRRMVGRFKVQAAVEWISNAVRLGEPIVVFVEHQIVLRTICKHLRSLRIRYVVLEGKTSVRARQAAIDAFQNHDYPVFIGTKAAKEGITLTAARHVLFVERFFTSAEEEQAEDRTRRIGQVYATTMWYLHAVDTIDDRIREIVDTKRQLVKDTLGLHDVGELGEVDLLLKTWNKHGKSRGETPTSLGLGDLPEPLPRPGKTHVMFFNEPRWNPASVAVWLRMNGYDALDKHITSQPDGRIRAELHAAVYFRHGTFKALPIAQDIKAITGARIGRDHEKKLHAGKTFAVRRAPSVVSATSTGSTKATGKVWKLKSGRLR